MHDWADAVAEENGFRPRSSRGVDEARCGPPEARRTRQLDLGPSRRTPSRAMFADWIAADLPAHVAARAVGDGGPARAAAHGARGWAPPRVEPRREAQAQELGRPGVGRLFRRRGHTWQGEDSVHQQGPQGGVDSEDDLHLSDSSPCRSSRRQALQSGPRASRTTRLEDANARGCGGRGLRGHRRARGRAAAGHERARPRRGGNLPDVARPALPLHCLKTANGHEFASATERRMCEAAPYHASWLRGGTCEPCGPQTRGAPSAATALGERRACTCTDHDTSASGWAALCGWNSLRWGAPLGGAAVSCPNCAGRVWI